MVTKLDCYVYPGWEPRIVPSGTKREWMDQAPESFPYRCLPLAIANGHGWDVLSPCTFEVEWNGGMAAEDVIVHLPDGVREIDRPVGMFGQGTFTFHIQGLFRTSPGWNLWIGGPPNSFKDGAAPLSGLIETDWSPYTFTMNWRLTRQNHRVRFQDGEPIAQIFPIQRGAIGAIQPQFHSIDGAPELKHNFEQWSRSRDAFQESVRTHPPTKPADKWQKAYYRGLTPEGKCPVADHQTKPVARPFANADMVKPSRPSKPRGSTDNWRPEVAVQPPALDRQDRPTPGEGEAWNKDKAQWLLQVMDRQRSLSTFASSLFRVEGLSSVEFLDQFYAPGRPVILGGVARDWKATQEWTPANLSSKVGGAEVEFQDKRTSNSRYELDKDRHKRTAPFDAFMSMITKEDGNTAYLTAYNSKTNTAALSVLEAELGRIDEALDYSEGSARGMMWIGPRGTLTPLHHDLTNNLLVQVVGRKRVLLAPPNASGDLYNRTHVFSDLGFIHDFKSKIAEFPQLANVKFHDLILGPGDALFIPVGWWHQVESLDFSVSMTHTNFLWPNDAYSTYPS
jgi:hypothetical protein